MSPAEDVRRRRLVAAGAASLAGQASALAFMLHATPYTTLGFVSVGAPLILVGMLIFAYAVYAEVKARADAISEHRFAAGETIFRQGDRGDCVYVVSSGEVEVLREHDGAAPTRVARLGPGEYFGEMALLTDAPRSATVRAATPVEVLTIHQEAFHSLYASVPALRASIEEIRRRRRPESAPGRPS